MTNYDELMTSLWRTMTSFTPDRKWFTNFRGDL